MRDEVGGVAGDDQRPDCAAVSGELAELALGTLTGRERVTALAHLEGCARCSAEVDSLSAAADQLLYLAPATEPPVGFEAGVFERLGLQGKPSRRRSQFGQSWFGQSWFGQSRFGQSRFGQSRFGQSRFGQSRFGQSRFGQSRFGQSRFGRSWFSWSPRRAVSIALCALVLAFGVGALVGNVTHGGGGYREPTLAGPHSSIALASLVSDGHDVGRVMVYAGNPTWLIMFINDQNWQGELRCEVVMQDGPTVMLGRFWLADGKGAWAASVDQPAGRLSEARIVNAHGEVLARADLS